MRTLTRYQQQQERTSGRFGRPLEPGPCADAMDDVSMPMHSDGEDGRFEATYRVDADAVASAIVTRLLAGGTLQPLRADDR